MGGCTAPLVDWVLDAGQREFDRCRKGQKGAGLKTGHSTRQELVDGAAEDGGDLADFVGEFGEFGGEDGLHAVGEGFFGLVMDFDEQAISADGDGGARKRKDFVALAGAVAGIDEDGQVAAFLDGGDNGKIEGVAGEIGKGAHAAFAEHDVVVAFAHDVFGGHEEFVEGGSHAALQEHGLFGAAGAFEQREILHVACADLDDVGPLFDEVEGFVVDGFGDDAVSAVAANLVEDFEAGEAESLEGVGRRARLVGAAAEEADARGLELLGDGEALLFGFDGAGAGGHGEMRTADQDVSGRRGDADDGGFGFDVERDELVGLGDGNAFDDAGHGFEDTEVDGVFIAGDADGGAAGAGDGVGFEAKGLNFFADRADLGFRGVGLHDDKHGRCPLVERGRFSVAGRVRAGQIGGSGERREKRITAYRNR